MEAITGFSALALLFLWGFIVSRLLKPENFYESLLGFFLSAVVLLVGSGYLVSLFGALHRPSAWLLALFSGCLPLAVITLASPPLRRVVWRRRAGKSVVPRFDWWKENSRWSRGVIGILATAVLITGITNLVSVLFTTPYIWDNMAYRLTRVAFWIQQGRIGYFDTAHDSRVLIQRSFEIILTFVMVVTGGRENLVGVVQYLAYWVGAAGVYAISRRLGTKKAASLFSSLVYLLLVQVLLQSTTANNDLFIAALLAGTVYCLLSFYREGKRKYLIAGSVSLALSFGVKLSTILALPSIVLLGLFAFARRRGPDRGLRLRGAVFFSLVFLAVFIASAFPAGYFDNWRTFNHPFGTEEFRKMNVVEGLPPSIIVRNTLKHLAAYTFDFLSWDGLPPVAIVRTVQEATHFFPRRALSEFAFSPETDPLDTWYYDKPWYYNKPPISHPDYSFWGVLGFAVVWPAVFLSLLGRRRPPAARVLAGGALLFILVHSASGGSWGHYTIYAAVFAVPLTGFLFSPRRLFSRCYLALAAALGIVTALTAVLFQYRNPLIVDQAIWLKGAMDPRWAELMPFPSRTDSVLARDRLGQLLRDAPQFEAPIRRFEEMVPPGAVVAICLNPHTYEYPLFGEGLTRRLIPLNSFWRGVQPIPPEAEYLLWADDFDEIFNRGEGDIHLGLDWWLRRL